MDSYRPLFAGSVVVALLIVAGCSAASTSAVSPAAPHALARSHGRPIAAFGKNYVYVADAYSNTVWIFLARKPNSSPVGSITNSVSGPGGLAVDAAGNLYVCDERNATVTIYPPGSMTPSLTLTQDLTGPAAVAVDRSGNVWVSNDGGGYESSVVEFPPGQTIPSTVINGIYPRGVAVDSKGNLYVVNSSTSAPFVSVYPRGATKPSKEFGQGDLVDPLGIAIGRTGDVYVTDYYLGDVFIYKAKSYKLLKTVFVQEGSLVPTLSRTNHLFVATGSQAVVSAIARDGFGKQTDQWYHTDLLSAFGLAADPAVVPGP